MLPLERFKTSLEGYKEEFDKQFDDLIMTADLIAKRKNVIQREDNGVFYLQIVGSLDECIDTLSVMKSKLEKVKKQRI